jgi:hypothetical protein
LLWVVGEQRDAIARSLRKYTLSPTHIGQKSFEFSRGIFSMRLFDSAAIQIGVVCPPR